MTITRRSFRGEERQDSGWQTWEADNDYDGEGVDCFDVLVKTPDAKVMQAAVTKGLGQGRDPEDVPVANPMQGPGLMEIPPRSMYSAEVGLGVIGDQDHPLVQSGTEPQGIHPTGDLHANPGSTGKGGPEKQQFWPGTPSGRRETPLTTGAGKGNKIVKTYGGGGVGGPRGV